MLKKDYAYGAVVFENNTKDAHVLLIQQQDGHWGFPKGHPKKNETEIQTAKREILEETGFLVELDTNFRVSIHYFVYPNLYKEVVYFIGYVKGGKEKIQKREVKQMAFVSPLHAFGCISYDNTADVLKQALYYRKIYDNTIKTK